MYIVNERVDRIEGYLPFLEEKLNEDVDGGWIEDGQATYLKGYLKAISEKMVDYFIEMESQNIDVSTEDEIAKIDTLIREILDNAIQSDLTIERN